MWNRTNSAPQNWQLRMDIKSYTGQIACALQLHCAESFLPRRKEGGVIWENSTLKGWQLLSQVPSQCSLPQKKSLCSLISDSLQALPSGHLRRGYSMLGFPPSLIQPPMTGNIGLRTQKCLIIELAPQTVQTMEGAQLSENQLGWSFQSTKKKIRFFLQLFVFTVCPIIKICWILLENIKLYSTAVLTTSVLKENNFKKQNPLRDCFPRLVLWMNFPFHQMRNTVLWASLLSLHYFVIYRKGILLTTKLQYLCL